MFNNPAHPKTTQHQRNQRAVQRKLEHALQLGHAKRSLAALTKAEQSLGFKSSNPLATASLISFML